MFQETDVNECYEEANEEEDDYFVGEIEASSSSTIIGSAGDPTGDTKYKKANLFVSNVNTASEDKNFDIYPNDVPSYSGASSSFSNSLHETVHDTEYNFREETTFFSSAEMSSTSMHESQTMERLSCNVGKQESQIGEQARILLNLFIQHHARETPVEPIIHRLCQVDKASLIRCGLNDESLNSILRELHKIAADISQNKHIDTFIESIPNCATQDVFCEVAYKVFADGTINWGRIVTVFYFGCRLVMRSLTRTVDNAGWVKEMLSWLVDFIIKHFAKWILSKGGWGMIKEWAKFSDNVWKILFFGSLIFGLWAYFRKP